MTEEEFARHQEKIGRLCDRIEAVMRQLPLDARSEKHVDDRVLRLVMVATSDYAIPRGDKAALRALETLGKQFAKTLETFRKLPLEAEEALQSTGGYSVCNDLTFEDLARRVEAAKERLKARPVEKRGGRPESRHAAEVSREVLRAYEWLTNKRAGIITSATGEGYPRRGEFLDFLTEIFKAVDIKASPVSQAKNAIATRGRPYTPDDYDALVGFVRAAFVEEGIAPYRHKQKRSVKKPD